MGLLLNAFRWVVGGLAFATWNPFKYLIGTDEVQAKVEEERTTMDWLKIIALILLPLGSVYFILLKLGILPRWANIFKKKTKRRRSRVVARSTGRRRRSVSNSVKAKRLRALAKARAVRRANLRRKKK